MTDKHNSSVAVPRESLSDLQTFLEEAFDGGLEGILQEERGIQLQAVRALLAGPVKAEELGEPVAYVLHKNGVIDWDQETIISNTGGDEQDARWKWEPVYRHAQPPVMALPDVDVLAEIIRRIDGNHSLGAGALAEQLLDEVARLKQCSEVATVFGGAPNIQE